MSRNTASTKEVILGTDNGQLHEVAVDEKDKREKYMKFLFELAELSEAFMGLQVLLSPGNGFGSLLGASSALVASLHVISTAISQSFSITS